MYKNSLKLLLLFLSFFIIACERPAESPDERVERIGKQLRCPVCRGVPISDSPAKLAVEMMEVVRAQVAAGKSDEEIFKYFEERYGEWALLSPKAEGMNLLIWILPVIFIVGGAVFIFYQARREQSD